MKKILTVYYSYSGNTKKIAEKIHDALGGDIAEIETVVPYSGDYDAVVDQGNEEVQKGFKPKIRPLPVNHADYDVIVLGTPVWWYTFAPAVKTFLESNDFFAENDFPLRHERWLDRAYVQRHRRFLQGGRERRYD